MTSVRRSVYPSTAMMAMLFAACLVAPLQAFSTVGSSSRHAIGRRGALARNAVFQDEDCEDLCDAFGEDFASPFSNEVKNEARGGGKSTIGPVPQKRLARPRRSRPLWWSEDGTHQCATCSGSGEQTCRFCGGTDFLSAIGGQTDALFYEGIGKDCPVCKDGCEVCHECAGTGFVFKWSPERNHTGSLHP